MNNLDAVVQKLPSFKFELDKPLAAMTYFKIGGNADAFIRLEDKSQISQLLKTSLEESVPITIWGGASNVIVADEGIRGIVLQLTNSEVEIVDNDESGEPLVQIGAGAKTALAVKKSVDLGFQGLEYFLGVPGSIGGAIYNNAHYLQDLIGEHVFRVEIIHPDGNTEWLSHDDCNFGYDTSRFKNSKEIIYQVQFALEKGDAVISHQKIATATRYRAATQPLGEPSSGCIFQNVPNTPALRERFPKFAEKKFVPGGFLIDQAGLKNVKEGGISVSEKHAAFFVNDGTGTAQQVRTLVQKVKDTVKEKFGVELEEEVFYVG